jgi:hypothetical protein
MVADFLSFLDIGFLSKRKEVIVHHSDTTKSFGKIFFLRFGWVKSVFITTFNHLKIFANFFKMSKHIRNWQFHLALKDEVSLQGTR